MDDVGGLFCSGDVVEFCAWRLKDKGIHKAIISDRPLPEFSSVMRIPLPDHDDITVLQLYIALERLPLRECLVVEGYAFKLPMTVATDN